MKKTIVALAACGVLLLGCVDPAPVVTGFNEASVEIQQSVAFSPANAADPRIVAEAQRICGTAGRRAEYASTRVNHNTYVATHLFLCLR